MWNNGYKFVLTILAVCTKISLLSSSKMGSIGHLKQGKDSPPSVLIFPFWSQSFFTRWHIVVFVSDVSECFFIRNCLCLNAFISVQGIWMSHLNHPWIHPRYSKTVMSTSTARIVADSYLRVACAVDWSYTLCKPLLLLTFSILNS